MPTTENGAPYPSPTDPNNIPGDLQALAEWSDGALGTQAAINDSVIGAAINNPASATAGALSASYGPPIVVTDAAYGAVGDGTTDDTAALQAALNVSTIANPRRIYLPAGIYKITDALVWPAGVYGTAMSGEGRDNTIIRQHGAGKSILAFTQEVHSVEVSNLSMEYPDQRTGSTTAAFWYDGGAGNNNFYHHVYQRIRVSKAAQAWAVSSNGTSQSLWNSSWEDIKILSVGHRAFCTSHGTGAPSSKMKGVGIYNTDSPTLRNTGAIFDFSGVVMSMENISVEGCTDVVFYLDGGSIVDVKNISIEGHHMKADVCIICDVQASSALTIDQFGVDAASESTNGTLAAFIKNGGRSCFLRNGRYSLDTTGAGAYIIEFLWASDPANTLIDSVVPFGGNTVNAPGRGDRALTTSRVQARSTAKATRVETASYPVVETDDIVIGNGSSITITLPDPTTIAVGRPFCVKNMNGTTLTVATSGVGKTIDGAATVSLAQWAKVRVISNGNHWITV